MRSFSTPFFLTGCLSLVASATSAFAQFSSNAATPLSLVSSALDDVQAKIAPAPNNGQFVSYFSESGYDIFLKRIDASGNTLWTTLVEDRAFSSTTDYGMTSDAIGNAFVVYNAADPNNSAGSLVVMASIDSAGAIRWKSTLYTATVGATSLGNGRAVVASDGFAWGAYSVGFDSTVARVNSTTGAVTASVFITEVGAKQICSGLQPSLNGAVLFSTVRYTTTFSNKILRVRKINTDGTYPWSSGANGVACASVGNIQTGNFPDFISDGSGGGYLPWYTTNPLQCRVQHVDTDGLMTWGTDGTPVGTNTTDSFGGTTATLNRTNPSAVRGADGRIYCFYKAYSSPIGGSVWSGIYGQCFDTAGVTQWGNGSAVEDYAASSSTVYDRAVGSALPLGSSVGVVYTNSSTAISAVAVAAKMNADGTTAWKTAVASDATTKYRFAATGSVESGAVMVWQGNSGTPSDIFAARVSGAGAIGIPAIVGDLNGDGKVDGADLGIMLSFWGPCTCAADLNGDGVVNGADLGILLANWTS